MERFFADLLRSRHFGGKKLQSKHISDFFRHFFSVPLLPALAVICSVSAIIVTSDATGKMHTATSDNTRLSSESTEPETTEAATVPMEPETEPVPEPLDYRQFTGLVPENSGFYQDRLAIIGDSIAYGFNAYGYIPSTRNIAQESLALWNLDTYTFDVGDGEMGVIDAAVHSGARLVLISVGMNDIPGSDPDKYSSDMLALAQQVLEAMPEAYVIIGSVTPVSADNSYTSNDTINAFNAKLRESVENYGNERLLYFDTNAILSDPGTNALSEEYDAGDGLHISKQSYETILYAMYAYLDTVEMFNKLNQ